MESKKYKFSRSGSESCCRDFWFPDIETIKFRKRQLIEGVPIPTICNTIPIYRILQYPQDVCHDYPQVYRDGRSDIKNSNCLIIIIIFIYVLYKFIIIFALYYDSIKIVFFQDIHSCFLKNCAKNIDLSLIEIFHSSFKQGLFPPIWK